MELANFSERNLIRRSSSAESLYGVYQCQVETPAHNFMGTSVIYTVARVMPYGVLASLFDLYEGRGLPIFPWVDLITVLL